MAKSFFGRIKRRVRRVISRVKGRLPQAAVPKSNRENFVFAIPVAPYREEEQWAHLNELLVATLRSVLNQSNPNFVVMVAGHERPEGLDQVRDPRIEFVQVAFDKPATPEQRRQDKRRKRWAIAARFRQLGGGYFMYLDADDYVHRDLTRFVLSDNNKAGYFIPEGYAFDYKNKNLAKIPGAWRKPFNHVCGSSGIIYFHVDDLPTKPYPAQKLALEKYFKIRNHLSFEDAALRERPHAPIPFRGAIYTVNNDLNLSNVLVRSEERQGQLIEGIRKRRIEKTSKIAEEFGISELLPSHGEL